jgi:signal transduction histidine kinase/ligand-binding sensor domain-containing protein
MSPAQSKLTYVACTAVVLAVFLGLPLSAGAEQLPVKSYTTVDGLIHNRVLRIVRDSRGFLWFCTAGGISRFDGHKFANYSSDDGLPAPVINDLLETDDGIFWIATNSDGVIRFDLRTSHSSGSPPAPRFAVLGVGTEPASNRVNVLYKDRTGLLWAGTDGGLFYCDAIHEREFHSTQLGIPSQPDNQVQVWALVEDKRGNLWIGTRHGLVQRYPDGRMTHFPIRPSQSSDTILALLIDNQDRLWLGHQSGSIVFEPQTDGSSNAGYLISPLRGSQLHQYMTTGTEVQGLYQASDGRIWIAEAGGGLVVFDGKTSRKYLTKQRARDRQAGFAEDLDGNLWLTTESNGALKIARQGFLNYGEAEGLGQLTNTIFENRARELYTFSSVWRISRFDGKEFTSVRPNLPKTVTDLSWRERTGLIQDHLGEWWISTSEGLFRFPNVGRIEDLARAHPIAVYTTRDGLPNNDLTRLFEDSRGDIWISSFVPMRVVVTRWERETGVFHRYSDEHGLKPFTSVKVFCEDSAGRVWAGLREGGLVRYRNGRFTHFGQSEGIPPGSVNSIYVDQSGRLWVAVNQGGLCRIDDPLSDQPKVITYTKAEGLSSNLVLQVTGDTKGRIYVAGVRGIDRIEPATGRIKHYSEASGLTGGQFQVAYRDRTGGLWFGTSNGLLRLLPEVEREAPPSPVYISGIRISGVGTQVSELGERVVSALDLKSGQNNLQIDYFALSFGIGEALNYQYKLEGSNTDWSPPTDQRTVNYANLAPGTYRFLVRAVNPDGPDPDSVATVAFNIMPPVWQRWWFILLTALVVGAGGFAFDRYRVARFKELNAALAESQTLTAQLTEQRTELRKANRTLALEATVTAIISDSESLDAALSRILEAVCEATDCEAGELWELDSQTQALRHVATSHSALKEHASEQAKCESGSADNPDSIPVELTQDVVESNTGAAEVSGARTDSAESSDDSLSSFGFPILLGSEVLGILRLSTRSRREPDEEFREMMSTIGSHLGQLIDRYRTEGARREAEQFRVWSARFSLLRAEVSVAMAQEANLQLILQQSSEAIVRNLDAAFARIWLLNQEENVLELQASAGMYAHLDGAHSRVPVGKLKVGRIAESRSPLLTNDVANDLHISDKQWAEREGMVAFAGYPLLLESHLLGVVAMFARHQLSKEAFEALGSVADTISQGIERRGAKEALVKSREERLAELERVRRRIATDLHDDIGSSLTQIAILSEVVHQHVDRGDKKALEPLNNIIRVSNELVDSMSDIVWAINPMKDHLNDLLQRMRRFASDIFTARHIAFSFNTIADNNIELGANLRREVFLVFKESVNNVVKHSGCAKAEIEFHVDGDWLMLTVRDDGKGFDAAAAVVGGLNPTPSWKGGNGIVSMRKRAAEMGGQFEIASTNGKGTTTTLRVPVSR